MIVHWLEIGLDAAYANRKVADRFKPQADASIKWRMCDSEVQA